VKPQEDGDIYLAGMLAIKLYVNLLEDPETAFCDLYSNLENHKGGLIPEGIFILFLSSQKCSLLFIVSHKS
jgi:hypothetical protein